MKLIPHISQFDHSIFFLCQQRTRSRFWYLLARNLSRTADGWFYAAYLACWVVIALHDEQAATYVYTCVVAMIVERSGYFALKNLSRRLRPPEVYAEVKAAVHPADRFSFPSGHTSGAFLFLTLVCVQWPALLPVLLCWACSIAFSRVVLGVHFPTDTLAGALLGTGCGLAVLVQLGAL